MLNRPASASDFPLLLPPQHWTADIGGGVIQPLPEPLLPQQVTVLSTRNPQSAAQGRSDAEPQPTRMRPAGRNSLEHFRRRNSLPIAVIAPAGEGVIGTQPTHATRPAETVWNVSPQAHQPAQRYSGPSR